MCAYRLLECYSKEGSRVAVRDNEDVASGMHFVEREERRKEEALYRRRVRDWDWEPRLRTGITNLGSTDFKLSSRAGDLVNVVGL